MIVEKIMIDQQLFVPTVSCPQAYHSIACQRLRWPQRLGTLDDHGDAMVVNVNSESMFQIENEMTEAFRKTRTRGRSIYDTQAVNLAFVGQERAAIERWKPW